MNNLNIMPGENQVMEHGFISISDEDGNIIKKVTAPFWNARCDPTGPCVCMTLAGAELVEFFKTILPANPLLQIELPFPAIKKVATQ